MQSEDIQNILLLARWRFDEYLETLKPALRKFRCEFRERKCKNTSETSSILNLISSDNVVLEITDFSPVQ